MTTTNNFVGLSDDAKLSSKVMKPPGGQCSDIFGSKDSSQDSSPPRRKNHMASDLFGGGSSVTLTPLKPRTAQPQDTTAKLFGDPEESDQPKKKNHMKSAIFDEDGKEEDKEKNKENVEKEEETEEENSVDGRNPVTGEGCEEEKEEEKLKQPAPRGRIPPGGYSSKLW